MIAEREFISRTVRKVAKLKQWVGGVRGFGADCIIVPEPTLEWQSGTSVGPELCINTPYK